MVPAERKELTVFDTSVTWYRISYSRTRFKGVIPGNTYPPPPDWNKGGDILLTPVCVCVYIYIYIYTYIYIYIYIYHGFGDLVSFFFGSWEVKTEQETKDSGRNWS